MRFQKGSSILLDHQALDYWEITYLPCSTLTRLPDHTLQSCQPTPFSIQITTSPTTDTLIPKVSRRT